MHSSLWMISAAAARKLEKQARSNQQETRGPVRRNKRGFMKVFLAKLAERLKDCCQQSNGRVAFGREQPSLPIQFRKPQIRSCNSRLDQATLRNEFVLWISVTF